MAAIPDYSSGATEHWGIITFRESNLLYNKNTSSSINQQRVASVVAHELAHQWFGNLGNAKLQLFYLLVYLIIFITSKTCNWN